MRGRGRRRPGARAGRESSPEGHLDVGELRDQPLRRLDEVGRLLNAIRVADPQALFSSKRWYLQPADAAAARHLEELYQQADRHVDQIHHAMDDVAGLTRTGEQDSAAILEQVRQIKDGSEQSLRLVDQLAQASDALRLQGERLSHQVGQFKLS